MNILTYFPLLYWYPLQSLQMKLGFILSALTMQRIWPFYVLVSWMDIYFFRIENTSHRLFIASHIEVLNIFKWVFMSKAKIGKKKATFKEVNGQQETFTRNYFYWFNRITPKRELLTWGIFMHKENRFDATTSKSL